MSIPRVNRFCFCVNLKTATTFGGMVLSFIDKGIACLIHHSHAWSAKDESSTLLIFIYVIISVAIVTTILMIIGSALDKYKFIYPFLALNIIDFHLTTLLIWYGTYKLFTDSTDFGFMALFLGNIAIAFAVYYWIVVYSRYMEIWDVEGDGHALLDDDI